jgi:SAM-dependent methyltransferase
MRPDRTTLAMLLVCAAALTAPAAQTGTTTFISYAEARPVIDALHDVLPPPLESKTAAEIESTWPDWVKSRDAAIRARLARGDEDSIVNLWLYGTSFTKQPRAAEPDRSADGARAMSQVLRLRLEDFIADLESTNASERMRFARQVIERLGPGPATAAGRERIRRTLIEWRDRMAAEFQRYDRALQSTLRQSPSADVTAYSSIFRDRGLSSDSSLLPDYGIERALGGMKAQGAIGAVPIRRVGLIGPGLDFTNKVDGYDFYPPQTTQPFALADSLIRLGLARADDIRVTAFDLSPRINQHLDAARQRARSGTPYVVQLPLNRDERWASDFVAFWQRAGDRIGDDVKPAAAPPGAGNLRVRAVRVRPSVVMSTMAEDLNIVVGRVAPPGDEDRFDLIVATNILVYYDTFEQALALANVARMLRPGGVFLANNAVFPTPPMKPSAGYLRVIYSDRQHDHFFWYQRE